MIFLKIGKFIFRTRLFENLRMLPHAPGVQMQGMLTFFLLSNQDFAFRVI